MWLPLVLTVLGVIEKTIPLVEELVFGRGRGAEKCAQVLETVRYTTATQFPGQIVLTAELQRAMEVKIAADVALANLLQAALWKPAAAGTTAATITDGAGV